MIISGWVLPDGKEILCGRLVNDENHLTTVEKYLEFISTNNNELYKVIQTNMAVFGARVGRLFLDDFATYVLGWIKIGNYPYKYVLGAGFYFQEKTIHMYDMLGYENLPTSIVLSESQFLPIDYKVDLVALFS